MALIRLGVLVILLWSSTLTAEPPASDLIELHTEEAKAYHIYREEDQRRKLELREKPIFSWTNLVGEHAQLGHLYLWLDGKRPQVIGTMFSTRASDPARRVVIHEFHTLATDQIFPVTPKNCLYQWQPKAGIKIAPCKDAPPPAATAAQRSQQIKSLARLFTAEVHGSDDKRWELRLLPRPLFEYEPASDEVLQGALLAMVSSAGTDPEILLLIEARHPEKDPKAWSWHAAALRFSDKDLIVQYNGKPLWSSLDDEDHRAEIKNNYTLIETHDKTYSCYRSRLIPELPDEGE